MSKAGNKEATVIWYDPTKGYGFLRVDGERDDVFVHNSAVRDGGVDPRRLLKGAVIRCNVGQQRGRRCAVEIGFVSDPPPAG